MDISFFPLSGRGKMEGCRGGAWSCGRRKKEKTAKLSGDQEGPETGNENCKRIARGIGT